MKKETIDAVKGFLMSFQFAIIVAAIVLANGFVTVQENKQNSIEKQAEAKLKIERKNDCLGIYEVEGKKWNNVTGWDYYDSTDWCMIQYKDVDTGKFFTKTF